MPTHYTAYWRMLQRSWWLIVLTTAAAVLIALVLTSLTTRLYRTSARYIISPGASLTGTQVIYGLDTLGRRSIPANYAEMMGSQMIVDQAATSLQLGTDALELYTIQAVVLPETNILELRVEGPDPQLAAQLANAIGKQTMVYTTGLYRVYDMIEIDTATAPSVPFSPQPMRNLSLALGLGLLLGTGLALLRGLVPVLLTSERPASLTDGPGLAPSNALLPNRRAVESLAGQVVAQHRPAATSLALIQLDGLEDLHTTIPAARLDYILTRIGKILRGELRDKDIVGRWENCCFAVILPGTPAQTAARLLTFAQTMLSSPLQIDRKQIYLRPRVGIAECDGSGPSANLVERTEQALALASRSAERSYVYQAEQALAVGAPVSNGVGR